MKHYTTLLACGLALAAAPALADTLPMSWTPPSGMTPGPIEATSAHLWTGPDGASAMIETGGLTPGNAVTMWFVAIQNPEDCAANPCTPVEAMGMADQMNTVATNGGGAVVGADGRVRISAFLPTGNVARNFYDTAFTDPETSEYHLVVHDHGPLLPELAADQLSSFRGGCTADSVPPFYPESSRTDGEGGPNTCVSRQVALFVPSHLRTN